MKNTILILIATLTTAGPALAETVFHSKNTKLLSVDCKANTLRLKNPAQTELPVREASDPRFGPICHALAKFAEEGGNGKAITLLTVEKKAIADFIVEQEVIGFVDVDYIVSPLRARETDPVFENYCGVIGADARSSSTMCLRVSRNGLYFLEFKSVRLHQLYKTNVTGDENQMTLTSKESHGEVYVSVDARKVDANSFEVSVSFEKRAPVSAVLKK